MRKYTSLAVGLAVLGLAFNTASAALRINEIRIDNFGTDTDEYSEIKGDPGESLDGVWYLTIGDHSGSGASKGSGVIESAISLDGEVIPSGGYYLIGSDDMTLISQLEVDYPIPPGLYENNDNTTHLLVRGYTGTEVTSQSDQLGDLAVDIDDDDDGVPNTTLPWTEVIDAVGLVETPDSGEWNYGAALGFVDVGPNGSFVPAHLFRFENTGEWQIGSIDFDDMTDTVKAPNPDAPTEPTIDSISQNYLAVGETLTIIGSNFTGATSLTIGGAEATFTVVDDATIEATIPEGDYGPIAITSPGGSTTSSLNVIILYPETTLVLEENFDTPDTLGVFTAFSVSSGRDWSWGSFDNNGHVSINGYANGAEPASDDWLVSPAIDLTNLVDSALHFQTAANFSGPDLEVYISTDYDGSSLPNDVSFTWTQITDVTLSTSDYILTDSGLVDLSAYDGQVVYIAFRYVSNGSSAGDGKIYQISQVLAGGDTATVSNDNPFAELPHVDGWVAAEITAPDGVMWLYDANWPLVYSLKHGWLYVDATNLPEINLYNYEDGGLWISTAIGLYPYMYFTETGQWAWFDIGSQFGNRMFYILTDDIGWITVPGES